jgi:hypothetical protein
VAARGVTESPVVSARAVAHESYASNTGFSSRSFPPKGGTTSAELLPFFNQPFVKPIAGSLGHVPAGIDP